METEEDLESRVPSPKRGIALSVLYWAEFLGLHMECGSLRKPHQGMEDAWWVSYEEEIDGPYRFSDVLKIALDGCSPILTVHASVGGEDPVPWHEIAYRPIWSNPRVAMLWGRGFWVVVALIMSLTVWGVVLPKNSKQARAMVAKRNFHDTKAQPSAPINTVAASSKVDSPKVVQTPTARRDQPQASQTPQSQREAVIEAQRASVPTSLDGEAGHLAMETKGLQGNNIPEKNPVTKQAGVIGGTTSNTPAATPRTKAAPKSVEEKSIARSEIDALQPLLKKVNLPPQSRLCEVNMALLPHEANPKGVLLLVPGYKKPAESFMTSEWLDFAKENHFAVVGMSLATGQLGLGNIPFDRILGAFRTEFHRDMPLLIFGYGVGADFALLFQQKQPEQVIAWCASGTASSFDLPKNEQAGAGIIVSTSADKARFFASWENFKKGRKVLRKWTWISLKDPNAEGDGTVQEFSRQYFRCALQTTKGIGEWYGNETQKLLTSSAVKSDPTAASFLPSRSLASLWGELNAGDSAHAREAKIIRHTVKTYVSAQPELNLFLRLPPGATDGSGATSVLAFSTWASASDVLLARLKNSNDPLIKFADQNNLAVLTWNTATLWTTGVGFDGLTLRQRQQYDEEFDPVARAWDTGVQQLVRKTGIPGNGYLLYGYSRGAHWGQRLALRNPERFLAVHIHVANSYDKPTQAASKCLWLVTSGETDMGYAAAREFYKNCLQLGYSMIFKAGTNLGHAESPEIQKISFAFFDYALEIKARRDEMVRAAAKSLRPLSGDSVLIWQKDFQQPPYIGDYLNQDVYPVTKADVIPLSQRIALPTRDVAEAWGELRD